MIGTAPATEGLSALPGGRGSLVALLVLGLSFTVPTTAREGAPARHADQLARLDAHLAAGDTAAAEALLQELQPELDGDERFALDTIYVLVGRRLFSEAKAQWNRLAPRLQESLRTAPPSAPGVELKRRVAEAFFVQGLLAARIGEREEALRLLRQADGYGFPPLDSPLMLLAAECLRELEEPDLAAQAYREVVKRAPDNATARLGLSVSLYSAGQLAPARAEVEEALRLSPGMPRARYTLGSILFEEKLYDEAGAQLERELRSDPRCVPCLSRLAHIAYLGGDDGRCESWLAKAEALDAAHVETNLVAGMLANRRGRYDEAVRRLSRVVDQTPDLARAHYQLALAYERSGNEEKAREHLEAYTRLIEAEKARGLGVRGAE